MRSLRRLLLQGAGVLNEKCNTRISLCCFLHCADLPSGMSSMPTVQQHLGSSAGSFACSGPSSGAQVACEEVSDPLQAPVVPVAGRISDVSELSPG